MAESSNSSSLSSTSADNSSSIETKNQTLAVRTILNTLILNTTVDSQLYMFLYALSLIFDGNKFTIIIENNGAILGNNRSILGEILNE